jgi:hypothetical protein
MSTTKILFIIFSIVAALVGAKIYIIVNTPHQVKVVEVPQVVTAEELAASQARARVFQDRKNKLVSEIMALNEYPDGIEKKINEFSKSLTFEELQILKQEMQDSGLKQDTRALALELVIRNQTQDSLKTLISFLENKDYDIQNDFENKIRLQGIEGLYTYHDKDQAIISLEKLEAKEKNILLAERYRRSVVSLRFNKPI